MAKPVITDKPVIDQAEFNGVTIWRKEGGSIEVSDTNYPSMKAAIQDIAAKAGIAIQDDWNTQYSGWYLIQQLKEKSKPSSAANGTPVWQLKYDSVEDAGNGLMYLNKGEKWGFASSDGNILIEPKYDGLGDEFVEDMIVVQVSGKGTGFVNNEGVEVIPPIYRNVTDFKNGIAQVTLGDEHFKINKEGKRIEEEEEDEVEESNDWSDFYSMEELCASVKIFRHLLSIKKDLLSDEDYDAIADKFYEEIGLHGTGVIVMGVDLAFMSVNASVGSMDMKKALGHIKAMSPDNKRRISSLLAGITTEEPYGEPFEVVEEYVAACAFCGLPIFGDPANEYLEENDEE